MTNEEKVSKYLRDEVNFSLPEISRLKEAFLAGAKWKDEQLFVFLNEHKGFIVDEEMIDSFREMVKGETK